MAKNKTSLLKESSVRRFMKLAELNDLSDHFVNQNYITEEEKEKMEMDVKLGDDVMGADTPNADDMGAGEPEAEVTPEEAEVIVALGDRLKASGITADGDEDVDMGDEEDVTDMDTDAPVTGDDEDDDDMQLESLGLEVLDDGVIKEALYKRVVHRLAATNKRRKLAENRKRKSTSRDALVERIVSRISGESKHDALVERILSRISGESK